MTDPLAKPATKYPIEANRNAGAFINFDDDRGFKRAQQGLIATHETGRIELDGRAVWDTASHNFLREEKQYLKQCTLAYGDRGSSMPCMASLKLLKEFGKQEVMTYQI